MTDKAARAALLTAKGMDKTSENIADYVADLLRQGRAKEITDDLIEQADPQRLMHHYKSGNTGMDLPMDQASRMARAKGMGFDTKAYHATSANFPAFDPLKRGTSTDAGWFGDADYFSPSPQYASKFIAGGHEGSNIIPAIIKAGKVYDWRKMEEGRNGLGLGNNKDAALAARKRMQDSGYNSVAVTNDILKTDDHIPDDLWQRMTEVEPSVEKLGRENVSRSFMAGIPRKSLEPYYSSQFLDLLPVQKSVDETAVFDPNQSRSQFARFDPRLDHLAHLSASTGGAMDFARHVEAMQRSGGQIAPSKYLPNVPRQVHAGGGKVAFMQGNHPLVPDVLYHGTARDIKSFDPDAKRSYDVDPSNPEETDTGWFGKGHYFTASPKLAAHYADEGAKRQGGQGASIIPAHVAMKNPFVVDMKAYDSGAKTLDNALSRAGVPMHPRGYRMPSEQTAALVGMGHDGVIATREGKPEEYVAFHPHQIKSAIGNQGTFDPNDPDITKAGGGSVDFVKDNPGGDWLAKKQSYAFEYPRMKGIDGAITGWMGGKSDLFLPTHVLKSIEPLNNEKRVAGEPRFDDLMSSVSKEGFDPHQKGNKVVVAVNHHGKPFILEGNTRVAVAHAMGVPSVKAEVRYWNGAEEADGPMHPDKVSAMAAPNDPDITKADGGRVDGEDDGITAYHGSPHDFDQFDISKLGTGEGAQAYGHGLYFAGNEGVAKAYRDQLSGDNIEARNYFKDGKILPNIGEAWQSAHDAAKAAANIPPDHVRAIATQVQNWVSQGKKPETFLRYNQPPRGYEAAYKAAADAWSGVSYKKNKGHMYKVKLNVKPHELLDWDKPLSEQHPNVQAAIKATGVDTGARKWENGADMGNGSRLIVTPHPDLPDEEEFTKYEMQLPSGPRVRLNRNDVARVLGDENLQPNGLTGAQIHQRLVDMGNRHGAIGEHLRAGNPMKRGDKWASEALMEQGLKGIRYLDAGSRDLSDGDPTHNYVMFHHDPVQVMDKYEYGGMVGKEEGGATGSLREKSLWPSAQAIKAGTGSREAHEALVNKIKPVSPYATPVPPASDQQVHDALTKDKQPKAFAPRQLKEGTPVAVRLDIPAYEKRNTWVVSVHHPKSDFTAGEVIGYDSVAHIGNPRFGVHPTGALNIASGKPKATIATVHGNWKKTTPEDAFKLSQTIHNDPQWRQVGMDPERHSYFYDRETQEPVMAADEALHIGPLVYAKNPVYGKKTDFAFSSGGDVSAALALTRRFTKDGTGATMALKPKGK